MITANTTLPEISAEQRNQNMQRELHKIDRYDWSMWVAAGVVILALTAAVASLSVSVVSGPNDPFYAFHISQSVRGLVGLVLVFSVYTFYQQVQLRRTRASLAEQMRISAQEQVRAEEFLKLAMLDPLTGLHNRRFAQERLASEISRAQRHGSSLTVLMLDLDELKKINDVYGHLVGDLALKRFGEQLTAATRGSDLAVRIGGDEFLVLLPDCQLGHVQRVLARLSKLEIETSGKKISFAFSAGWTNYLANDTTDKLLERADHALYAQKQTRKNAKQKQGEEVFRN